MVLQISKTILRRNTEQLYCSNLTLPFPTVSVVLPIMCKMEAELPDYWSHFMPQHFKSKLFNQKG